jgi:hypothetical protein
MKFVYNDGKHGPIPRKLPKGGDCVTRAIAIATQIPYDEVARQIDNLSVEHCDGSDSKHGVYKKLYKGFLKDLGWTWTPTMGIGTGCKVHLSDGELPMGRLIVSVSKHLVAVIDGVINDLSDCSRQGKRCVYGYYQKK